MPIVNVVDGRKRRYRFRKINAVIEAAWHDNSVADADTTPRMLGGPDYEEWEHTSLAEAIAWANAFAGPVTLFLYDEDGGIYASAQGIEARRAETGTGSVHESPVGNADAPIPSSEQAEPSAALDPTP